AWSRCRTRSGPRTGCARSTTARRRTSRSRPRENERRPRGRAQLSGWSATPRGPLPHNGSVSDRWEPSTERGLRLPSGRLVRGRGLRRPAPPGPDPTFGVYLLGRPPPEVAWEHRWLHWPDFRLPSDRAEARRVLQEAWERAADERVE